MFRDQLHALASLISRNDIFTQDMRLVGAQVWVGCGGEVPLPGTYKVVTEITTSCLLVYVMHTS
jgi:hypothetical protein